YALGVTPRAPYALAPTAPFGVPQILSLAFWGGVWGIALWPLVTRLAPRVGYWVTATVLGAIGPSLVAWFVVAPLKWQPIAGGWQARGLALALVVNGAWGGRRGDGMPGQWRRRVAWSAQGVGVVGQHDARR